MIKFYFFFCCLSFVVIAESIGQTFSVNEAITSYESLVATNQNLPAAKQGFRIADYFFSENKYREAIKYYAEAALNASKTSDVLLQAKAQYKKGVSQKRFAESGKLSMADEQLFFKDCILSFKTATELYSKANKIGSPEYLYSMFYGGEALHIVGSFRESNGPLKTALKYAQKNRIENLILGSSDLLAKNYQQLDEDANYEYYQSIFESYNELKVSKDSLKRAQVQIKLSKDSLSKSHQKLVMSIDSLERTQKSLKVTSESLNKSKDSLVRSKESLKLYEASLEKSQDSLMMSIESLEASFVEIALLDSANLQQRSALEIRQSEIIQQQAEIINQQKEINNKEAEVKKKKAEVSQLSMQMSSLSEKLNYSIGAIGLVGVLLFLALLAYQYKRRTNKKLEHQNKLISDQKSLLERRQKELKDEKSRTEVLLLNILPEPVADELRRNKKVIPRYYKMVSIMFTDFKGFTTIAAQMSPGEIVRELDACFIAFDQIIEKYENAVKRKCIEKIKTIGDGYMCAGGIPIENDTNPLDLVRVGLAMTEYMEKRKVEKIARNEPYFEIRIGINTGPVVAGVVGKKKFAYDIWGDAVNLASRLESTSEVGRVNISAETYKYVKDKFFFTQRGKINAKNKGEIDMYFVDGRVKYNRKETKEPTP